MHYKRWKMSLKRECTVVTLFRCVTLLSVVPQQHKLSSHGASSITLFCWTTIPQGKSLVWPSWLSTKQFSIFLSFPSLKRKYNWEISSAFSLSSKSFAYIVCSHTNHQLSGLAVFVLEDCMAVAVSCLIQIATVKESRNFGFNLHITLIHLLCDCLTENQWLQSLPMDQHLWLNYLRNAHTDTTSQNNLAEVKHWITMLSLE